MAEDEADDYRAIASHSPASRAQMVEVASLLKEIQAMPFVEVAKLREEGTLRGAVAAAWLEVGASSLKTLIQLGFAGVKIAFSDLMQLVQANLASVPDLQVLFQTPPQACRAPSVTRSGRSEGLGIETSMGEKGDLIVLVSTPKSREAEWEGLVVEVIMRVEIPVSLGEGAIKGGRLELLVPQAGALLERLGGPIDQHDLSVVQSSEGPFHLDIPPLHERENLLEHPRLLELPHLDQGLLRITISVPQAMRTAYDGQNLELFGAFALSQWQKLVSIVLTKSQEVYEIRVEIPNAPDLSGRVAFGLRYVVQA
jgi:hypothetical protein